MPTERIKFAQPIETRDGTLTKDSLTSNGVFEKRGQKIEFIKRPGLVYGTQLTSVTPPAYKAGQGIFAFGTTAVAVVDSTVYTVNPHTYANTNRGTISASTNKVFGVSNLTNTYFFFHNKINAYLLSSAGAITTPTGLPSSPYVSGAVFLDNYMFLGTSGNEIYNCNIADPTTWNALGKVTFNTQSDQLVGIARHLNYLVAFGGRSIMFFYDAAVAAPSSPLDVATSYTLDVGCANGDSIVSSTNSIFWIGKSKASGKSVYMLDGVSPIKISTNAIDRCLETDGLANVHAYVYKFSGHTMYILNLHTSNITLAFDVEAQMWYQWTQYATASGDQPNPGTMVESYFRPISYAEVDGVPLFLDDDVATVYTASTSVYQDNGQPIYYRVTTDLYDNGVTKAKFYGRLEIVGDKVAGGTMQVRHTGDDYNSWSSWRTVDLHATRSQIYQCGRDRRRAWQFLCTSNVPLRLECAEIDFRLGEMDQEQAQGGGAYRRT